MESYWMKIKIVHRVFVVIFLFVCVRRFHLVQHLHAEQRQKQIYDSKEETHVYTLAT